MSTYKVDFDELESLVKSLVQTGEHLYYYEQELRNEIASQYSGLPGGASNYTTNSKTYLEQKITAVHEKMLRIYDAEDGTLSYPYTAGAIDDDLATQFESFRTFSSSKESELALNISYYRDTYEKRNNIEVAWYDKVGSWFIDTFNDCPFFEAIGEFIGNAIENIKNLCEGIQEWYILGGGREMLDISEAVVGLVIAIGAAIVAIVCVALTVVTFGGFAVVVAVLAALGAVLAALSAGVNVWQKKKAYDSKMNGDPTWAKIYAGNDSLPAYWRRTNFGDGKLNRLSMKGATAFEATKTVCDIASIAMIFINPGGAAAAGSKVASFVSNGGKLVTAAKLTSSTMKLGRDGLDAICTKSFDAKDFSSDLYDFGTSAISFKLGKMGDAYKRNPLTNPDVKNFSRFFSATNGMNTLRKDYLTTGGKMVFDEIHEFLGKNEIYDYLGVEGVN